MSLRDSGYSDRKGSGTLTDFTVVSLIPSGGERWIYRYNGPADSFDRAGSIAAGPDGNLYAAGFSEGSGTWLDFTVINLRSHVHNVGTASVDEPPDTAACDDTVLVAAMVCNYGDSVETFDVEAIIDSSGLGKNKRSVRQTVYADTQTVVGLDPGDWDTVSFTNWVVPAVDGVSYTVTVITLLAGDDSTQNDTLSKGTLAWCPTHDAGTVSIVSPPDTVPCGLDTIPQARVCNYGNVAESFDVACYFDSSGNIVYGDTAGVVGLAPGDTATVDFSSWTACTTHDITYLMTVTALLSDDSDPANDSLQKSVTTWCPGIEELTNYQLQRTSYKLDQNWPNPFTAVTSVQFSLRPEASGPRAVPSGFENQHVSLGIYDISGRLIRTLFDEVLTTEHHRGSGIPPRRDLPLTTAVSWDGRDDGGDQVASGIYFYSLQALPEAGRDAGRFTATKKLILLR